MNYIPRVYQDVELHTGATMLLTPTAANHLIRVLRLKEEDSFKLFNGKGGEFIAKIASLKKKEVLVYIERFVDKEAESPLNIHLGQGISRGDKMDWVIQKAVELGVRQITPLITAYCGVRLSLERWDKRLQHWRAIAIAACEQCGRNRLPVIAEPQAVEDWLPQLKEDLRLVCDPDATVSLSRYSSAASAVSLLIGPESGLSEGELALAKEHGCLPLSLGPRILRTETAAVAAVSMMQAYLGDMDQ